MDGDTWLHLAKDHPYVGLRLVLWLRQRQSSCWVGVRRILKGRARLQKRILPGEVCHLGHRERPVAKGETMA